MRVSFCIVTTFLAAVVMATPLRAQSWDVTEFPPDPITDARTAKAALHSTTGREAFLSVVCEGALVILVHVNGLLTPTSRSDGLYWGVLRARFDKRPAITVKTMIGDGLDVTGFDAPTTRRILPILLKSHELWLQVPVEHMDERIQFLLPEDTKTAIAPVTRMCRAPSTPKSTRGR
jgi:hypothetical protein